MKPTESSTRNLARVVARLALRRGSLEFSANDLPEGLEHGGSGNCGTVFRRLVRRGVLRPVGWVLGEGFVPKVVKNEGGNKIGVYALADAAQARAML